MYKNWKAICGITDPNFRLFIALCTEQETLLKIAFVFPEFFVAKKPEQPGPFPLSYLRRVADSHFKDGREIGEVASDMPDIMLGVGMQHFYYGSPDKTAVPIHFPLTIEHRSKLKELRRVAEKIECFPWGLNRIVINGTEFFTGLWTGDDADDIDVDVYPTALVDVNA